MKTLTWNSLADGEKWVHENIGKWQRPCLVLLEGDLGAGKTQITKWIVQALGGQDPVTSPTFGIHHRYQTPAGFVDHVDLYRLESAEDLESTGFWDLFNSSDFILVEWAQRLPEEAWPPHWQKVFLDIKIQGEKRLVLSR